MQELSKDTEKVVVAEGSLSTAGAIFSLTKTAIGVGLLYSPKVMHECGLGLGTFMLLFAAVTSCLSLHYVGIATSHTKTKDYVGMWFLF